MAELNQHDEIAGGVDRGAFQAVMNAMASRDPKRVALAEAEIADAVYSLSDLTSCVHSSLNEAENARYMLRHPRKSEGKTPVNTSKEG